MAFRCSCTNLFASFDEAEAELQDSSVDGSEYTASVRVYRPCAECGEEAAEYTFELSESIECPNCGTECGGHYGTERDLPDKVLPSDKLPEDHPDYEEKEVEFLLESEEDPTVDESGGGRYKKNLFTCSISASVECGCCGETFTIDTSEEAAASYFETLV